MADKEKDQREENEKLEASDVNDVSEREKLVAKKLKAAVEKKRASAKAAATEKEEDELEDSKKSISEHDETPVPSAVLDAQDDSDQNDLDKDQEEKDQEDEDQEEKDQDNEASSDDKKDEDVNKTKEDNTQLDSETSKAAGKVTSDASDSSKEDSKKQEDKKQGKQTDKKGKKKSANQSKKTDTQAKTASAASSQKEDDHVTTEPREGDVIGGVFTPKAEHKPLTDEDLKQPEDPTKAPLAYWFVGAIIVVAICAGLVFAYADNTQDIKDVLAGTYKAKKIAERERIEEEHRLAELKKQNKFGNLVISGYPQYATLTFNGKPRYGMTSTGEWREVSLIGSVPFKNLNIKDELEITISAPGFQPITEKITEGTWQKNTTGDDYSKIVGANLAPLSEQHKLEFAQRLAPDVETEFFGTITINSKPAGATVTIDGHPLKNAEGVDLKTPVTFDKNYVFNEETKKYDEVLMKVDTVLDIGHKITVGLDFPNTCKEDQNECVNDDGCCPAGPKCNVATDTDCKYPTLVTALQRQNWTCTFDEEKLKTALESINEGKASSPAVIQEACTYTYTLNADLEGIKTFARDQEAERQRIQKLNAELEGESEDGDAEDAQK